MMIRGYPHWDSFFPFSPLFLILRSLSISRSVHARKGDLRGEQPLVDKGSRQNGSVTSGQGLALRAGADVVGNEMAGLGLQGGTELSSRPSRGRRLDLPRMRPVPLDGVHVGRSNLEAAFAYVVGYERAAPICRRLVHRFGGFGRCAPTCRCSPRGTLFETSLRPL